MKITKEITTKITITGDTNYISWTFDPEWKCIEFDSNMPHYKSDEDWEFYYRSIKRMLKELHDNT